MGKLSLSARETLPDNATKRNFPGMQEKHKLEITIHDLAFGGEAVGRLEDGRVAFVRGALPGEKVTIRIREEKRSFVRAELEQILTPSPARIVPECPLFGACPGCSYLHGTYEAEVAAKQKQFTYFLTRGGLVPEERILPPFPSPRRFGNRNRIKLAAGSDAQGVPVLGYRGWDNKTLLPISCCLLANDAINEALAVYPPPEEDAEVTFRFTEADGVRISREGDPGAGVLHYNLPGFGTFTVAENSFFQTNTEVAAELLRRTVEMLRKTGCTELLELYCGAGVFSIAAAENIPGLHGFGVELDRAAIRCAQNNAAAHRVGERCRFAAEDAARYLKRVTRRPGNLKGQTVLVDPPRSGLHPEVIQSIGQSQAEGLIYVSCAPDTLRRDLERLDRAGYAVAESGLLDMFPGTAHFETVSRLIRKG